jgi:sec-independent protein translocase protein TatA
MRLGLPELLVILVIIILIFGSTRLAGLGKGLGQAIRGFKDEMGPGDKEKDEDRDVRR